MDNLGTQVWKPLSEVAELSAGYPFRSAVTPEPGGTLAVVPLSNVSSDDQIDGSVALVINKPTFGRYLLRAGDVVIQARGVRHPAGVVGLSVPAIAAPGLHVLRPDYRQVTSGYLSWCLNHPKTQAAIAAVARGTHAPLFTKQEMGRFRIPVPSLEVQARIVKVQHNREVERELALRLSAARDLLVDTATWEAAVSGLEIRK